MVTSSFSPTGDHFISPSIHITCASVGKLTTENDRLHVVVFTELPDEQLGEIVGVDELSERLSGASYDKRSAVLYK